MKISGASAVVMLRCVGPTGTKCVGLSWLEPTSFDSRSQAASAKPSRTRFSIAAGRSTAVRVKLPRATRRRIALRGKAVVRLVVRPADAAAATVRVRRLLTLYPAARGQSGGATRRPGPN
jgi:hypothetical protein